MVLAGIIAFGIMLVAAFVIGCGIAEAEIWMKEKEKEKEND